MDYCRGIPALALLAWGLASAVAVAAEPAAGAKSLLLLRNGNILEGEVTQAGDYYVVLLGTSEVRLPARDVEAQVASLDEAYQLKKFGLFGRGADPHLNLAEWCLRHGLAARCGEQLVLAKHVEPENPKISQIERRLAQAREVKPQTSPQSARPVSSVTVRSDDLEKAIRALPKASVERFAAVVQPLLVNRCGANQCHGANSKAEFHVLRPPAGQAASQRFTQRNLYAALQYIDRSNPDESPLLVLPQKQHGSSLMAVFDKQTQKQLDELKAWVKLTVAAPGLIQPEPIQPPTIPTGGAATLSQPVTGPGVPLPNAGQPAANDPSAVQAQRPAIDAPASAVPASSGDRFVPRDPFDPEIFNRRIGAKR
ncbi:MAG: hypothetical protein L0211_24125 [Planctomycetaceae bacterium]|nr:hypothetical protein [Planctomycetaceae bacterium]